MPPANKGATAAKKSDASAKAAVQATITLKHLAAVLSDSHDLPKKQAEAVLGDLDGTEPGDGRGDQDQGEGRLPAGEGTQGSGVERAAQRPIPHYLPLDRSSRRSAGRSTGRRWDGQGRTMLMTVAGSSAITIRRTVGRMSPQRPDGERTAG